MKTIIIFVKVHIWIGYLIDFNQAKSNEECTVHSGVSKCFEVDGWLWKRTRLWQSRTARPVKLGWCRVASDIKSSSQLNSGGRRLVLKPLLLSCKTWSAKNQIEWVGGNNFKASFRPHISVPLWYPWLSSSCHFTVWKCFLLIKIT